VVMTRIEEEKDEEEEEDSPDYVSADRSNRSNNQPSSIIPSAASPPSATAAANDAIGTASIQPVRNFAKKNTIQKTNAAGMRTTKKANREASMKTIRWPVASIPCGPSLPT